MKTKIQLGLILVLALFALSLFLSTKATPQSPLFVLKRVQEKAFLSLKTDPKERLEYMRNLLDNRLSELSNVVRSKDYNFVLSSASRYSTLAGQITDLIISNNLKDQVEPIKQKFISHEKILYDLYVFYPKNHDDEEYKYIEDDINYLKIYSDKLTTLIKSNN